MSLMETSEDVIVHEPSEGELWIVRRGKLPAFASRRVRTPPSTKLKTSSKIAPKISKLKLLRALKTKAVSKKSL